MSGFFDRLDGLAEIGNDPGLATWLDRAAFVFLFLMAVTAPHSIAASQASWLLGVLATALRLLIKPRRAFRWKALDVALGSFFLWAVLSSIFSYEPAVSLDKLRGVSLILVFYFAYLNIRNLAVARFLALALIFSCLINVAWVIGQRFTGRGVEVASVAADGPLGKLQIVDGTTLLTANGRRLDSPEELVDELTRSGHVKLVIYQYEFYLARDLDSASLLPGATADERLGIGGWSRSYNWRAQGFFGHFTTYAEALQLIASLLFGIIVASLIRRRVSDARSDGRLLRSLTSMPVLVAALASICIALLLTVTRASQLAFMVSAFSIIVVSGSRKLLAAAALLAVPVVLGGLIFLQQTRNVGFVDASDQSTQYRLTMWRDGVRLSTASTHNLFFGVGMDSIKKHWQEWGMFDGGRLPLGHFHSTPVQLMTERGVPSLVIWLAIVCILAWTYLSALFRIRRNVDLDRWTYGILLGSLGGLVGFFVSGLVHYNLGDGEVALIFYLVMALGVRTSELALSANGGDDSSSMRMQYRMAA